MLDFLGLLRCSQLRAMFGWQSLCLRERSLVSTQDSCFPQVKLIRLVFEL